MVRITIVWADSVLSGTRVLVNLGLIPSRYFCASISVGGISRGEGGAGKGRINKQTNKQLVQQDSCPPPSAHLCPSELSRAGNPYLRVSLVHHIRAYLDVSPLELNGALRSE